MPFQPQLVTVDTVVSQSPVVDVGPAGAAGIIVNVGGVLVDGVTQPGPDAAVLTAGQGSRAPFVFVLPAGASLAFPAGIGPIYARAANTTTTLSCAIGFP